MSDTNTLEALVAYAQEVLFGYEVTLRQAPVSDSTRAALERMGGEAGGAADALRHELTRAGGKVPPQPDPNTAPPAKSQEVRSFLEDVITVEEAAVARYYTALQELDDERHIKGTAAFMAQAGRRLVRLRKLAGQPLLPRAFETGGA
jgi:hypothetical protein